MAHLGLGIVRERIAAACADAGRAPGSVTLVAVSKHRSDEDVRAVHAEGQLIFGENRAQELAARTTAGLPDDIVWHFIGPLQSRKVPLVAASTMLLQSMDRMRLARRWAEHAEVPVLIQFNLAGEPQKSGFAPADADRALDEILALGIDVRGVMAIPPIADDPEDTRPWFAMLRSIFDASHDRYPSMDVCSMGMTNDLEVAVAEGATMVRIGRAIFETTKPSGR